MPAYLALVIIVGDEDNSPLEVIGQGDLTGAVFPYYFITLDDTPEDRVKLLDEIAQKYALAPHVAEWIEDEREQLEPYEPTE